MAVQNVTPERKFDLPLEGQLTGAGARMLNFAAPYSFAGAGYQLLPNQGFGQIYMPGPNATLMGNNPFNLTPYGQGYFGGTYNSIAPTPAGMGGYAGTGGNPFMNGPQGAGYGGTSYNYVAPQGQSQTPRYNGPGFGQAGFPYMDFAQWQQGFYGLPQTNPYPQMQGYYNNPWPGYGYGGAGGAGGGAGMGGGGGGGGAPAGPPAYSPGAASGFQGGGGPNGPAPGAGYTAGGGQQQPFRVFGYPQGPSSVPFLNTMPWMPTNFGRPGGMQPNPTQAPIPASSPYGYKYAGNQPQQQQQKPKTSTTTTGSKPKPASGGSR